MPHPGQHSEQHTVDGTGPDSAGSAGFRGVVRAHPVIVGVLVGCTLAGIGIGVVVLPAEWALLRRAFGGALGGAGVGLLCTATRIIG
jgi:hypothetical protein